MTLRRLARWGLYAGFLVTLAALGLGAWGLKLINEPLSIEGEAVEFTVPRGATIRQVARALEQQGIFQHPWVLEPYARVKGIANRIKAGEYLLESGLSARELLALLVSGRQQTHRITFLEGWTFSDALAELKRHPKIAMTLADLDEQQIRQRLGIRELAIEGVFFPDTYKYLSGDTDASVLSLAYERMTLILAKAWSERAAGLPLETPYEALVLASLIEKEAAIDEERELISGVFIRRLNKGMRLQTDPTVIYGLGEDYSGKLTRAHLRRETPFNTYIISGLPPTPIAMPGRASILAALNPKDEGYLYFVSKKDGSHHFSRSLKEHNRAVKRYLIDGDG